MLSLQLGRKVFSRTIIWLAAGIAASMSRERMVLGRGWRYGYRNRWAAVLGPRRKDCETEAGFERSRSAARRMRWASAYCLPVPAWSTAP